MNMRGQEQMSAPRPQPVQAEGADRPAAGLERLEVSRGVRVLRGLRVGALVRGGVQNVVELARRVTIEGAQQQDDRQGECPGGPAAQDRVPHTSNRSPGRATRA